MLYLKNITISLLIISLVFTNLFLLVDFVAAADGFSRIGEGLNKTADKVFGSAAQHPKRDLPNIIGLIIRGALSLLGVIYLIMLIIGGFMWVGSKGNKEVVDKAKDIIIHATVGLCMTLVGYAITAFMLSFLTDVAGL